MYDTEMTETHPAFTVNFSPEEHALCGDLSYSATFDNSPATPTGEPFAYIDDEQRKIVLESDEIDLIG